VPSPVRLERDGDVAELVLADPPLHLFGGPMLAALQEALARLTADPPRALLLRAEGETFCAGADVAIFQGATAESFSPEIARMLALVHAVEDLPAPTVAAVDGLCLTAGLELALGFDLLLAAPEARFGLVERRIAITPMMGGTQRIAERAGPARAREMVMTGRLVGAEELERWGVVNRVVARDALLDEARALVADLAAGPTRAMAATKRVVRAQLEGGARAADARTAELTAHLLETEDARGAVDLFLREGPRARASFRGR
jgi:enoyl-CoA hydratase/carnithine racemase